MGSELDSGSLLEGRRGVRRGDGDEGGLRGVEAEGGIVTPSMLASSPSRVVPLSTSTASPHVEQNLALGETCAPHLAQNMGSGDSTIGSGPTANACKNG